MGVSGSNLSGRPLRMQAQRVDSSDTPPTHGPLKDVFGEYTIVTGKFNERSVLLQKPDGSEESINPILKQAFCTPPRSNRRIDCSDEVDWEGLNEIPDLGIARASVAHKHVEEFMQMMKSEEKRIVDNDIAKKMKICARMLKGKEIPDMGTDDEAEETECETAESSDEEGPVEERKENQQRKDEEEDHAPQGRAAQRKTPMPEEQTAITMTPMSDSTSVNESIDKPRHPGQTEGRSSQKRKGNEMEDSEDEAPSTAAAKRANTDRRGGPGLTVAERQEQKRLANRRKKQRVKAKRARARHEIEERALEP
ncbi:unnamed protein product [Penicillium egyptiacum]|uniref:Uncharacterized protein n=1 Tax=Penicillium egyptiacum TaxID=1303716 RepID=A0A9W4NYI0_9EURO|nr:unnamed protein product [Penicillium egyptiacum]